MHVCVCLFKHDPHKIELGLKNVSLVHDHGTYPIRAKATFNPYKPSVLFVGYRQTVQAQIRHSTVCLHSIKI